MKIILSNGSEFEAIGVHGTTTMYQGSSRDSLTFLFNPESVSIDTIIKEFTADNCTTIKIQDSDTISVHDGYSIRTQAGVGLKEVALGRVATEESDTVVYCKMVKITYAEEQILAIRRKVEETASKVTDTQVALCEVYEMVIN